VAAGAPAKVPGELIGVQSSPPALNDPTGPATLPASAGRRIGERRIYERNRSGGLLQTTNAWLKEIMEANRAGSPKGLSCAHRVLHALRDRLTVDDVAQLGAQLPIWFAGSNYVGRSSLECSITSRIPEIRTAIRRS
jgi:hypothetical protein